MALSKKSVQQILIAIVYLLARIVTGDKTEECKEDGNWLCRGASDCNKSTSLYDHKGGSAQAFKPNAPTKSTVCDDHENRRLKVATWPLYRRTHGGQAPKIEVQARLWSCQEDVKEEKCCCSPVESTVVTMEVWQSRPDGTYSSLVPGQQEGDCRATVPVKGSKATFESVAPGSTGTLGGLGPNGWDFAPYGAPVVHLLVTADDHDPLLIHVPFLLDRNTLEQQRFWGSDWRGPAYFSKQKGKQPAFSIEKWTPNVANKSVKVELNVFLTQNTETQVSLEDALCPSYISCGLPGSFFLEPISVCCASMLDFFEL